MVLNDTKTRAFIFFIVAGHECTRMNAHKTFALIRVYSRLADNAFPNGVQDQLRDAVQIQFLQDMGAVGFDGVQA